MHIFDEIVGVCVFQDRNDQVRITNFYFIFFSIQFFFHFFFLLVLKYDESLIYMNLDMFQINKTIIHE